LSKKTLLPNYSFTIAKQKVPVMKNALNGTRRALLLLAISVLVFRCSDDDDDSAVKTSDLILGSWQTTGDIISPPIDVGAGPISDLYAELEACDKDDLYIFKANGVGEFNEGPTKCDPGDPQSAPYAWSLANNDKNLLISQGGTTLTFEIAQLDNTRLILVLKEDYLGTVYTETITYTRK
jgi:hypothetical protein